MRNWHKVRLILRVQIKGQQCQLGSIRSITAFFDHKHVLSLRKSYAGAAPHCFGLFMGPITAFAGPPKDHDMTLRNLLSRYPAIHTHLDEMRADLMGRLGASRVDVRRDVGRFDARFSRHRIDAIS
jgi:hypothetical protein